MDTGIYVVNDNMNIINHIWSYNWKSKSPNLHTTKNWVLTISVETDSFQYTDTTPSLTNNDMLFQATCLDTLLIKVFLSLHMLLTERG